MKWLFIILLILYIILFYPIKLNIEYLIDDVVIIRIILFDISIMSFKYIIKSGINKKMIRKFLFNINHNKEELFLNFKYKTYFLKNLIRHITINYIDIVLYTDKPINVSSYYFGCKLISNYLYEKFYYVKEENYLVKFDTNEHLYFNMTISIKLYQILKELVLNVNNLKYIFGRRLGNG